MTILFTSHKLFVDPMVYSVSQSRMWPSSFSTQYDVRAASVAESLKSSQEKVFSEPNELFEIEVAEVTPKGIEDSCIETDRQLRDHLSTYHSPSTPDTLVEDVPMERRRASYFLLEPQYGWSHLPITKSGAMDLLSALGAFPELYSYIATFSDKIFPRDEGFAGFDSNTTIGNDGAWTSFESCYLLKYVDRRDGTEKGANPWSIRHALIYQKIDRVNGRASHLLARVPVAVTKLLGGSLRDSGGEQSVLVQDWSHLHTACFSSVKDNLRQFINYLDQEITCLFNRVIMAGVEPEKLNQLDELHSTARDLKELQYLSDQIRRVISIVELNILTLKCFQKKVQRLKRLSAARSRQAIILERFLEDISRCHAEHQFGLRNASSVLDRAKAASDQLRDTVSMRNGEFNKRNTEMTNQNTSSMCHLANKSGREAYVLKTLTVLALVFVPAGFVADFLQMGYVSLKGESAMEWYAAADLKIYAILSIPLISLTMLIYAMVEMVQGAKERKLSLNGNGVV